MRILALTAEIPFPPVGGGPLRIYHLLRALAPRHELTLVGFTFGREVVPPPFAVRVVSVPWEQPRLYREMEGDDPERAQRAWEELDKETDEPWFASFFDSPAMETAVRKVAQEPFDLVLIEDPDMGRFLPCLRREVPRILDFQNVYSLIARRAADGSTGDERDRAEREAERTLRFERRVASECRLRLACSAPEAEAARRLLGIGDVEVVPNGVDTVFFTPQPGKAPGESLLFTGTMSYAPNVDAVDSFVREVLPLVRRAVPAAMLHVVGKDPTPQVRRLAGESVIVHGQVPDMRPHYQDAGIVVVPIRRGGGTRLKVLEAAASGKAIVSTSLGVEGLEFSDGDHLLVADTATAFAAAVIRLIHDAPLRERLGRRAREAALAYDWDRIGSRFSRLVATKA